MANIINGTNGADDFNDTIFDDIAFLRDGDDQFGVGLGKDTVYGGAGHDLLFDFDGGALTFFLASDDKFYGGSGNDFISSG